MNFRRRKAGWSGARADINITPLVDIVFQLLIFFMLTATFVRNPNFDINLPQASSKLTSNVNEDIRVNILKDGTLKFGSEAISLDGLKSILAKKVKADPTSVVLIQADKETRHGRVVEVMDTAKMAGFSRLGIAVEIRR